MFMSEEEMTLASELKLSLCQSCHSPFREGQIEDESELEWQTMLVPDEYDDGYFSDDDHSSPSTGPDELIQDCGPAFNDSTQTARASDEALREYACMQSISKLGLYACPNGNRGSCPYQGRCVATMEVQEIWTIRSEFWRFEDLYAPGTNERRSTIIHMLNRFYDEATERFQFSVKKANGKIVNVCERSFMTILGYKSVSSQWNRCKAFVRKNRKDPKKAKQIRSKPLFEFARAWIIDYAKEQANMLIYQAELKGKFRLAANADGKVPIRSLPFESVNLFFKFFDRTVKDATFKPKVPYYRL